MPLRTILTFAAILRASSLMANASNWTNWNNNQNIGSFYGVAGTAKETVAVGVNGRIATRKNSTGVWKTQAFVGDADFRAVVYGNGQYVAVREAGLIMTSKDGFNWKSRESSTRKSLLGVFWDGHQFLAGGAQGTILSSTDGADWMSVDSGSRINLYAFSCSSTRYVAVGGNGILISGDSIVWTKPSSAPSSVPFTACTWTGAEFLACGLGLNRNPTIYTSPDGDVWTLRDTAITTSLRAATTLNGAIYIAGDSVIAKSTDGGATWADIYSSTSANNLFMGLANNGAYLIAVGLNQNVWAMPLSVTP